MKIGVFGGTFNPIHYGHLRVAEEVREILEFGKVLFIPSGNPPLKEKGLADAGHRYIMTRMAVDGHPDFEVLDIECGKPGKSYTVETMKNLLGQYKGAELYFILGIDAFLDIPHWWKPGELLSLVNFALLSRPESRFADLHSSPYLNAGKELLSKLDTGELKTLSLGLETQREAVLVKVTEMAISSTDIRNRIREGRSIKYLLPGEVESFIISNRLYLTNKESERK